MEGLITVLMIWALCGLVGWLRVVVECGFNWRTDLPILPIAIALGPITWFIKGE